MNGGNIRDMAVNKPVNQLRHVENDTEKPNTRVLSNGAIYDMDKKRIVALKPELASKNVQITSETASAMQARRYEVQRERIASRVMQEISSISDIPIDIPEDAYAFVVGKQTLALVDSDKPRFDDVEKLGQLMGTVEKPRSGQREQESTATDDMAVALRGLVEFLQGRSAQVVDGDVIPMRSDLQGDVE